VIGVVAAAYVVASAAAGRLADRVGAFPLLRASLWVYGVGLLLGAGLSSLGPLVAGLPIVALAGAVVMTLPYVLLVRMTPAGAEGAATGLFSFSRALGASLGPIVVGVSLDVLGPLFPATHGYGAMWIAIGLPILLSLPLLKRLETQDELDAQPALVSAQDDLALAA
jgi:MFS family permease